MVSKVTKRLNLRGYEGFTDLTPAQKAEVKSEVADFVKESILDYVGEAKSPVNGRAFKGLSKDYKKVKGKLSSSRIANLELTGDMLDSLDYQIYRDGVEVGIFDSQEALKADNHNKFSSASKRTALPKRQFIPNKGESFTRDIESEIGEIIKRVTE